MNWRLGRIDYFSEGWRLMLAGRLRKEPPLYHTRAQAAINLANRLFAGEGRRLE